MPQMFKLAGNATFIVISLKDQENETRTLLFVVNEMIMIFKAAYNTTF